MRKVLISIMILTLLVSVTMGGHTFARKDSVDDYSVFLVDYDFEDYSENEQVRTAQFMVQTNGGATQPVVISPFEPEAHGMVAKLDVLPSYHNQMRPTYTHLTSKYSSAELYPRLIRLHVDVLLSTHMVGSIHLINHAGGNANLVNFAANGQFTPMGYTAIDYDPNKWYSFEFYLNFATKTYTAIITDDAGVVAEFEANLTHANATEVKSCGVTANASTTTQGTIYTDNFVYAVPKNFELVTMSPNENYDDFSVEGVPVIFEFTNDVDESMADKVTVVGPEDSDLPEYEVGFSGKKLIVTFKDPLQFNSQYSVRVDANVKDVFEQKLNKSVTASFKTIKKDIYALNTIFKDNDGIIDLLPDSGVVITEVLVNNPLSVNKEVTLYSVLYDGDNQIVDIQSTKETVAKETSKPLTVIFEQASYTGCYAKAFVCENMNLISAEYGFIKSEDSDAEYGNVTIGNGISEIAHTVDIFGDIAKIDISVNPPTTKTILITMVNKDGEIVYIEPVYCGPEGKYSDEISLDNIIEGDYTISVSGRNISNKSDISVSYISEITRNDILNSVNSATTAKAVKDVILEYKQLLNIDEEKLNENTYLTLYEQKPYTEYLDVINMITKSDMILDELINSDFSSMYEIIEKYENIIIYNVDDKDYKYYLSLGENGKNKVNIGIMKLGSISTFKQFRTFMSTAVASYKKELNANKGNGGSSGGSGSGGSGGGSYSVTTKMPDQPVVQPEEGISNSNDMVTFKDIYDVEWATESILYLQKHNIVSGDGNMNFRPLDIITREEIVKLIVEVFNIEKSNSDSISFSDEVAGTWYNKYLSSAKSAGIINGIQDNTFGVGMGITRQDLATIVYRTIQNSSILLPHSVEMKTYADDNEVADYAKEAVYALQKSGIMQGIGNMKFEPMAYVNRAQAAKVMHGVIIALGMEIK